MNPQNACQIAGRVLADAEKVNAAVGRLSALEAEIEHLGIFFDDSRVQLHTAGHAFLRAANELTTLASTLLKNYHEYMDDVNRDSKPAA